MGNRRRFSVAIPAGEHTRFAPDVDVTGQRITVNGRPGHIVRSEVSEDGRERAVTVEVDGEG